MSSESVYRGDIGAVNCTCDILDKRLSAIHYVFAMLNRTNQMFEWKGLPDTIPAEILELYLQINGQCAFTEVGGEYFVVPGNIGGPPDPYYRNVLYVSAVPGLRDGDHSFSRSMKILNFLRSYSPVNSNGECVLIKNDTLMEGMLYMYARYAAQLTENDISIRSAQINARAHVNIVAENDRDAASARAYVEGLEAGKIEVIMGRALMDSIKTNNLSMNSANVIIQLIELQQYLKASWYNEIGLNANFNMKREYQSEEELQANIDVLLPLVDNMLACRREAAEFINKQYGLSISVDKNSSWENKQKERDTEQETKEAEKDAIKEEASDVQPDN